MHRRRVGVVGSDTRLCFELFHPLRHGTLCGRAFAILPKQQQFCSFLSLVVMVMWRVRMSIWGARDGMHGRAPRVCVRSTGASSAIAARRGWLLHHQHHTRQIPPHSVLAAVHGRFLRTKLCKCAHALAERGTVQHSNRLVVASRPHRAPHADSMGVRLDRWIFPPRLFSGDGRDLGTFPNENVLF